MQNLSSLADTHLAELLKEGNELAFREIYVRYWDKLYIIACKRLDNPIDAEEVVQDIFCNLWRKRSDFILTKGFSHYFAVAVKFEVINQLAKRARKTRYEKEVHASFTELDHSTLHALSFNELKAELHRSVEALPEKCRLVFRLKYEKDYSQKQIAKELHISEKTVEAHLLKARKALRGTFGNLLHLLLLFF